MRQYIFLLFLIMTFFIIGCQTKLKEEELIPLDRTRTPEDQKIGYELYLKNPNLVKNVSERFDYEYTGAKYYKQLPPETGYAIVVDYNIYPKVEMELSGLHTIVKLDQRILDYNFDAFFERDMGPERDMQLNWKPYEEGYFFAFGGTWDFSCLPPEEFAEMGLSFEELKNILNKITVTTIWDGGSETVELTCTEDLQIIIN